MGELKLPSVPASVPRVRAFVQDELRPVMDEAALFDVLVATTEAAGNAVAHGGTGPTGTITTTCSQRSGKVVISIEDQGRGFEPPDEVELPDDVMDTGGRGLLLVQSLMDSMRINSSPYGTLVTMERAIAG